jgi:hypothetical protein
MSHSFLLPDSRLNKNNITMNYKSGSNKKKLKLRMKGRTQASVKGRLILGQNLDQADIFQSNIFFNYIATHGHLCKSIYKLISHNYSICLLLGWPT